MRILKLKGLIAAAFTPFAENGEVNYGMIPKMAIHCLRTVLREFMSAVPPGKVSPVPWRNGFSS